MAERSKTVSFFVLLVIIFISTLVLVKSDATAESVYQTDGTDFNPNRLLEEDGREIEATTTMGGPSMTAPNYFIIPPSGFVSDGYDPDGLYISFTGGYITAMEQTLGCIAAPVNLPLGTKIVGMDVRVSDQNNSSNQYYFLSRINLETGDTEVIATVNSPYGTTAGLVSLITTTITEPLVSDEYAYQINTCIHMMINTYAVKIGYSYDTYLPSVLNGD
ncbi:MAG: hypothetical protein H0S79_11045 [Anaerolineaceae bacterium]|nr:hypothetical protein [Anaerolineaceae bacterium]